MQQCTQATALSILLSSTSSAHVRTVSLIITIQNKSITGTHSFSSLSGCLQPIIEASRHAPMKCCVVLHFVFQLVSVRQLHHGSSCKLNIVSRTSTVLSIFWGNDKLNYATIVSRFNECVRFRNTWYLPRVVIWIPQIVKVSCKSNSICQPLKISDICTALINTV